MSEWFHRPVAAAMIVGAVGVVIGLTLSLGGTLAVAGVAIALVPWFVFERDERLIAASILVAYLVDWFALELNVLPPQASWLFEGILIVLILRVLLRGRGGLGLPFAGWLYLLFVILSAFLALLTGQSTPAVLLVGLRKYLRLPLLGAVIGSAAVGGSRRYLWWTLFVAGLVQIPVLAIQFLAYGPGDHLGGTLGYGGSGVMGLFLSALLCVIIVSPSLVVGFRTSQNLLIASGWFAGIVASGAALPVLLTPAGVGVALIARHGVSRRAIMYVLVVIMVLVAVAPFVVEPLVQANSMRESNINSIAGFLAYDQDTTSSGAQLSRLGQVAAANSQLVHGGLLAVLFGYGPGAASPSALGDAFSGRIYLRAPVAMRVETSLARGLLEVGYLGMAVGYVVLLRGLWVFSRVLLGRKAVILDELLLLGAVVCSYLLVCAGYNDAWNQPVSALPFWIALGAVYNSRRAEAAVDKRVATLVTT
jgi:hypothetical protein